MHRGRADRKKKKAQTAGYTRRHEIRDEVTPKIMYRHLPTPTLTIKKSRSDTVRRYILERASHKHYGLARFNARLA